MGCRLLPQEELIAVFPSGLNFNKGTVAGGTPLLGAPLRMGDLRSSSLEPQADGQIPRILLCFPILRSRG